MTPVSKSSLLLLLVLLMLASHTRADTAPTPVPGQFLNDPGRPSAPPPDSATEPTLDDLNKANLQFMAWQAAMIKESKQLELRQSRLLYSRMRVPPPLPPSQSGSEQALSNYLIKQGMPVSRVDVPLPLPIDAQLTLFFGEPSVSFNIVANAVALTFAGVAYRAGVSYSAVDNKWLIGDAKSIQLGLESGPVELTGTYQYDASRWGQPKPRSPDNPAGLALSGELGLIRGAVGYNTKRELRVAAGYDFLSTPKPLKFLAKASIGLEARGTLPVVVQGLTPGKPTLSSYLRDLSVQAVKLLPSAADCPYCSTTGHLDCDTCDNSRKVICPKCQGGRRFSCDRCKGGGRLVCWNCKQTCVESCRSCGGAGLLKCSRCRGKGKVTVYETEQRSRQVLVVTKAGFDGAGNPMYDRHYETHYYTVKVPSSQPCDSCSGDGLGGTCGTCGGDKSVTCHVCGGDGTVACRPCRGSGMVDCSTCRGTGNVRCPECRGEPILCPLCKGKKQLGL